MNAPEWVVWLVGFPTDDPSDPYREPCLCDDCTDRIIGVDIHNGKAHDRT